MKNVFVVMRKLLTYSFLLEFQVVELLAPYHCGGKIGLFGGDGVGKMVLIVELINNIAKAHGKCSPLDPYHYDLLCMPYLIDMQPAKSSYGS
jgi:hypothetical protein